MAVQVAEWARRIGVTAVGLVAAGGLIAGCSSSGSGKPSFASTGNGASTGGTTAASGGASSTSGGGAGSNPFCSGYTPLQLSGLSSANNLSDVVKAWDNYANTAPSDIKPQAQDVAKYLHDVQNKNYSALSSDAQKVGMDLEQIGTYIGSHCHS